MIMMLSTYGAPQLLSRVATSPVPSAVPSADPTSATPQTASLTSAGSPLTQPPTPTQHARSGPCTASGTSDHPNDHLRKATADSSSSSATSMLLLQPQNHVFYSMDV
ncbi:hypothetical protein ZHAS_00013568 [Anopheles sinensis]|uniref:Uncharacterized protein n=1 Tax=Anopheles sinensis TaxID=74873 RepID=A0A084W5R0_ANOSI|nr:hypothetical protein ZHAS_00013568 [Anopheles sinensis]